MSKLPRKLFIRNPDIDSMPDVVREHYYEVQYAKLKKTGKDMATTNADIAIREDWIEYHDKRKEADRLMREWYIENAKERAIDELESQFDHCDRYDEITNALEDSDLKWSWVKPEDQRIYTTVYIYKK